MCDAAVPLPQCDPFAADPDAANYLPRLADCVYDLARAQSVVKYHDVIRRSAQAVPIAKDADGDLTTGTGARFVVDKSNPSHRVVRVLTDRLGELQAFMQ
jgi:hypothetical protein